MGENLLHLHHSLVADIPFHFMLIALLRDFSCLVHYDQTKLRQVVQPDTAVEDSQYQPFPSAAEFFQLHPTPAILLTEREYDYVVIFSS